MKSYLILDTNILLIDANNLVNLGKDGTTIVIPETVLDEIDNKKSGFSEIAFQAREFNRMLTRAEDISTVVDGEWTTSTVKLDGVNIELVSCSNYPNCFDIEPNIRNDRKIIYVASHYKDKDYIFMTNDVACKHRAKSLGLKTTDLKQVETIEIDFVRDVILSDEIFATVHNKDVFEIIPDHKPNHFNYKLINEYTGHTKLATVSNNSIQVIGKETDKEIRKQDVTPANAEQLFFSKALQDPSIQINICEAKAGSGKTILALSNGIKQVRKGVYDSIIYIRASVDDVEKVEEIGFLSGNDEKVQVYLEPLEDSLEFIVRNRHKDSKQKGEAYDEMIQNKIEEIRSRCNIQSMIGLGMRGRTFHNAYVIIDEAQNQSKASLQKMLTRFGKNCKIVIIGSNKQIDNPYITKYTNGLSVLLDACTREHENINLHAINLPKVLRGPIAEFAEDLFSAKGLK